MRVRITQRFDNVESISHGATRELCPASVSDRQPNSPPCPGAVITRREVTGMDSSYPPELFAFSSALHGYVKERREMGFISKEGGKKKRCLMKREGSSVASKNP